MSNNRTEGDRIVYEVKDANGLTMLATYRKASAEEAKGRDPSITINPTVVDVTALREQIRDRMTAVEQLVMFPEKDPKPLTR